MTGILERGVAFYASHGVEPKRLLNDNALGQDQLEPRLDVHREFAQVAI